MRTVRMLVVTALMVFGTSGCLHAWGPGSALPTGRAADAVSPTPLGADQWLAISAEDLHACGVRADGALLCWTTGELASILSSIPNSRTPVQIGSDTDWTSVSVGFLHTCGIRGGGDLYCWGYNWIAQTGTGDRSGTVAAPTRVGTASDWIAVSAGQEYTCGIRSGGELSCWGAAGGRGGLPHGETYLEPTRVGTASGWSAVSTASTYACGIRDALLFCWGQDPSLAGSPLPADHHVPRQMSSDPGWTAVSTGPLTALVGHPGHLCAIRAEQLACLGSNASGQLGDGTTTDRLQLTSVPSPGSGWLGVSVDDRSTCAISGDHRLWCWGSNHGGQLGDGTTTDRHVPTQIGSATNWNAVEVGPTTTYGITGQPG